MQITLQPNTTAIVKKTQQCLYFETDEIIFLIKKAGGL